MGTLSETLRESESSEMQEIEVRPQAEYFSYYSTV